MSDSSRSAPEGSRENEAGTTIAYKKRPVTPSSGSAKITPSLRGWGRKAVGVPQPGSRRADRLVYPATHSCR
jgi:hypothetical protein